MDARSTVAFLEGGGEMGARMRAFDWARTPLGPPETWPPSLRTVVRIMLDSRYAMWMLWGPDLTFFCNDAYLPTVGIKRDWVLGARSDKVWAEIWPDIGPRIEHVLQTGEATWDEALQLFLERSGYPEETYHTFSYSPVYDDGGRVAGMLCVVTEDTLRQISERRIALLGAIGTDMATTKSEDDVFDVLRRHLGGGVPDLPCALAYITTDDADATPRCALRAGFPDAHAAAPMFIAANAPWPVAQVLADAADVTVDDLGARFSDLPTHPWRDPPRAALLLPIRQQGHERPAGVFIACLNRYRPLDDAYRRFLELLVAQLAAGLANARSYLEERRRAEALAELDRAKTAFFSNVSHEFRTPLTLMMGPLEDLLQPGDTTVGNEARERLAIVHRNSLRLLKLVNSLLDFSRLESGRLSAHYEQVDIGPFTAELASVFRAAIERAGVAFHVDCPPVADDVYVDASMWEKIVFNLLSNAFKHTLAGEISVRMTATNERVQLVVADTGVGIPEDALAQIFDRFYRVPNARSRTFEGSGIGLALVQELVKLHGGRIDVASSVNQGSTFTVSLPRGKQHLPESHLRAERSSGGADSLSTAYVDEAIGWLDAQQLAAHERAPNARDAEARETVLLVDDNADMRSYVERLLATRYNVMTAADGEDARKVIARHVPDLVLTDVMMPRLDGFGLLKAIRDDVRTRDVPVVMLSARAGEESRIEGLDAGADDYLVKPFSARELHARIANNLAMSRARKGFLRAARQDEARRSFLLTLSDALRSAQTEDEIADIAVNALGADGGFDWVGYGVMERDRKTFRVVASWRREGSTGPGRDATFDILRFGEADARAGHPLIIEDTRAHVGAAAWADAGVGAIITVPWIRRGRSPAMLWVSTTSPRKFSLDEIGLVRESAARIWTEMTRARAESALRESEERFRTMADSSPLLVWVVDPNGTLQFVNRAVHDFFGDAVDALRENGWSTVLHPIDAEDYEAELRAALRARRSFSVMARARRSDGEWRWIQSIGAPRFAADGRFLGAVASSPDVTELIVASDALREADRRKDEFLATLAHELRNPLAPIRQAARLAQSPTASDAQRNWSQQVIERQVRHMALLLDDLLDVSRITRGKLELRREHVQLASVIESALETAQPFLDERRQTLDVRLPEHPITLFADPLRIAQVLANLLTNAAKYSEPHGRVVLTARVEDNRVAISVRDSGIGIERDLLPRIFEMFSQVKSSLDRAEGGLGIGLALVKGLVELHEGSVEASSEGLGRGAEFIVRLPLPSQTDVVDASPSQMPPRLTAQQMRILVADDNRDAAASLATLLALEGHETSVAHDGDDALSLAESFLPTVALLDIGMPKLNGYEVAQRIRAAPWGASMMLVAVTGWGQSEDKRRAHEAGFDHHFTKPLDLDAFGAFLRDALAKRSAR
jgi:PAS domain S-box-containing protein